MEKKLFLDGLDIVYKHFIYNKRFDVLRRNKIEECYKKKVLNLLRNTIITGDMDILIRYPLNIMIFIITLVYYVKNIL